MRLHRFYIPVDTFELDHNFWVHDDKLRNQWIRVLRYRQGDELVLFDGVQHERLYKILRIEPDGIELEYITDFERKLPDRHVYLFFSLLKKDKTDWVLQKATELGVSNFIPILAARSEKTGFNLERAEKIVIEAAEQCGRSDIPHIREPLALATAVEEYGDKISLYVCDETLQSNKAEQVYPSGVFVGPEGGWTETELALFKEHSLRHLFLGKLTLRAETAAITASAKLLSQ